MASLRSIPTAAPRPPRPASRRPLPPAGRERPWRRVGVVKYEGTQKRETMLSEMIERKTREAREVCVGNDASGECRVAWDEVEEVSQAKADLLSSRFAARTQKPPSAGSTKDRLRSSCC